MASQLEPSSISPSPNRQKMRELMPSLRLAWANPTLQFKPWPKEPVETSMPFYIFAVGMGAEGVSDFVVVVQQLFPRIHAHIAEDAIQQNAVMPFAEYEHIAVRFFYILRVEAQVFVIQGYGDVGGGERATEVNIASISCAAADILADFAGFLD